MLSVAVYVCVHAPKTQPALWNANTETAAAQQDATWLIDYVENELHMDLVVI